MESEGLVPAVEVHLSLRAGAPAGPEIASQSLARLDEGDEADNVLNPGPWPC